MKGFVLSGRARRDVAGIIGDLHSGMGAASADDFERRLFFALHELVRLGGPGHRRSHLTQRNFLFEFVHPYFIIFEKKRDSIHVIRVLHSARDIAKLL